MSTVMDQVRREMAEAVHPDEVKDWKTFRLSGRVFEIRPLVFKWDKEFRRQALPMIASQLQPIEMLLVAAAGDTMQFKEQLGISKAMIDSEIDQDNYLPRAVAAICASQDTENRDALAVWTACAEEQMSREAMIEIIEEQLKLQRALDNLGNSLARRLTNLSALLGKEVSFSSLVLPSTTPATPTSGTAGSPDTTSSKSSGTSTERPTRSTSRSRGRPEDPPRSQGD